MRSNRWLLGLGAVAIGACLALGAGHGVAAAESESADGGPGPSSAPSSQSTDPSPGAATADPKDADKGHDSTGGPVSVDKPTSTVSASTVTVDRTETVANETVEKVTSAPAKRAKQAEPAARPAIQADAAPEPAAQRTVDETTPSTEPQPKPLQAEPIVEATAIPVRTPKNDSTPATEVAPESAAIRSLAGPVAHAPPAGPVATVVISLLSAFGLLPPAPPVPNPVVGGPPSTGVVTGVKVGRSNVQIPVGSQTYTGAADWYFPTQADGTVQAQGVMWLQHGFLGSKSWYSALAQRLAQQTNSVVVVPNVPSFPFFTCSGCSLSDVAMQQGVAGLFADPNRTSLNASANAAGYAGTLPQKFILTGHSAGGGLAAAAGGFYTAATAAADNDLLGVVMFDGVSSNGTFAGALASLDTRNVPVYQIAAPPQAWNAGGQTTGDLVALRPGQFVGAVLAGGSHVDSLIGGAPIIDFFSQLLIKPSPPGNTQAVYTLASGWINDMYAGRGPADPLFGVYGEPGQSIVLGPTTAVVLGTPAVVNKNDYFVYWYDEQGGPGLNTRTRQPASLLV